MVVGHRELAQFALELVSSATVRADDRTLQSVLAVKEWLRSVASGKAVVTTPEAKS